MRISSSDMSRVDWPSGVDAIEAEGPCEGGDAACSLESGEGGLPSVEYGEGSLAGAHFGRSLWSSAGEGVRAGAYPYGLPAKAALEGLPFEGLPFEGLPLAGRPPDGQAGASSLSAFLVERGLLRDDLSALSRPAVEGALSPPAPPADRLRARPEPPPEAVASQERVHEWGRELERDGGASARAQLRPGPYETPRRSPEPAPDQARSAPWLDLNAPARRAELFAPRRGDEAVDDGPRDQTPREAAPSEDAFVIHDLRRCPANRLRFEVDASFRDAHALCRFEFDDATYGRATLDGAGAGLFARAAAAGHPSAVRHVAALLRAFAAGEPLGFPVALEPAAAHPRGEGGAG
jgi:hypothetical protein